MSENFSILKENKTVKTLCRLSPSRISSVKCLKLNGGRCITVFSTGKNLLHIVENHQICVSIKATSIHLFLCLVVFPMSSLHFFVDYLKYENLFKYARKGFILQMLLK